MNLDARPWIAAVILSLLALSPEEAHAGMTDSEVKAFELYKAKAEQGWAEDKYELGRCYYNGLGVAKDELKAMTWWRKAAEQGSAKAQFILGNFCRTGEGVDRDMAQAATWFRKAADGFIGGGGGYDKAQCNLGVCYAKGEGVTKDMAQAISWWLKAAEKGNGQALANLGVCYAKGEGVAKDRSQAYARFRKAYECGYLTASAQVDFNYDDGAGVARQVNLKHLALAWDRPAAERGDALAQYKIANYYAKGVGVAKDEVEAYAYYRLSGMSHAIALKDLAVLEKKMSADQIAAGERRMIELQKEIEAKIAAKNAGK